MLNDTVSADFDTATAPFWTNGGPVRYAVVGKLTAKVKRPGVPGRTRVVKWRTSSSTAGRCAGPTAPNTLDLSLPTSSQASTKSAGTASG